MSVILGPSSVTFHSDFNSPDPAFDSFTWRGNAQFFIPTGPNDLITDMYLDFDWGGHNEVNRTVQFEWVQEGPAPFPGVNVAAEWIVTLTFGKNGRWVEDFAGINGNPIGRFDLAFEGPKGLRYWGPNNTHLPPQDQILAEGAWAPHHHAAAHHDGWLFA